MNNGMDFDVTCSWNRCNFTFAFDVGTNDIRAPGRVPGGAQRLRDLGERRELHVHRSGTERQSRHPHRLAARQRSRPQHGRRRARPRGFPAGCSVVTNFLPKPVHFDDSEHTWNIGAAPNTFDVETVALHEFGHILGLAHSNVAGSVMFPTVSSNFTKRALTQDDIDGVRSLYPGCGTPVTPIVGPITAITPITNITPINDRSRRSRRLRPSSRSPPLTPVTPITPIIPVEPINPIRPVRPARSTRSAGKKKRAKR